MIREKYILALDQGTTSSRAILFDQKGNILSQTQKEFKQYFPKPAWVEHNPEEIWSSQFEVMHSCLKKARIDVGAIAAIGITNQRETTICWDKITGKAVYNAIVWQDRRTASYCQELIKNGYQDQVQEKTGLLIDAYFSASKIRWILDHVKDVRKRAENGEIAFGTIDSWLLWKLSGGRAHKTDVSNASRTMLFNIHNLEWDAELLQLFDIPQLMLPEVKSSSEVYCNTIAGLFDKEIVVSGIAGDQQAALFGQMCVEPRMLKCTYGTGCFIMMNTGNKAVLSKSKLLTTIGWQIGEEVTYALEGSVFVGGAVIQWLRDGLRIINHAGDSETLAASVTDNGGVYFVSALSGLGAPYWDPEARGLLIGITRGTTKAHIARASLESIGFRVSELIGSMAKDANMEIDVLRVDGGAVANDLLMQIQADLAGVEVLRPVILETTALGAAYLAGLAIGYWKDKNELSNQWNPDMKFRPSINDDEREKQHHQWKRAVERAKGWEQMD